MQRTLAAAALAAVAGVAGAASAADGSSGSLKDAAPAFADIWSGFYAGANFGGAWTDAKARGFVPATSGMVDTARALEAAIDNGNIRSSGPAGGVEAGYNWQRGSIVYGLEASFDWLGHDQERDTGLVTVGGYTGRTVDEISRDWLFTFGPRLGYAVGNGLIYATGGLAVVGETYAHAQSWSFGDGCPALPNGQEACHVGKGSDALVTWTVGAGVQFALTDRWSVKGEYLYIPGSDLSFTSQNAGFSGQPVNHTASIDHTDIVRVGFDYKLGGLFGGDFAPLK